MVQKRSLRLYMVTVCILGMGVLTYFSVFFPIHHIYDTIFFVVLALVAETQTVFIGEGKTVSVNIAVIMMSMLICGPAAALWVATASICGSITKIGKIKYHIFNTRPIVTFFNISNYILSMALMCIIYFKFNGEIISSSSRSFIVAFLLLNKYSIQLTISVIVGILLNSVLISILLSIKNGINFLRTLAPNVLWPIISVIIIGILGVFLTALYVAYGWFLVVLFFLPFMLSRYVFTTYKDLQQNYLQTVESLASAIEAKDEYTSGHSRRVEQYCGMIAREMKLSLKRSETLKYAALLHDIGKIGIPEKILNKPGRLDQNEWEYIKSHPEKGAHIIEDIEFLSDAVEIVRTHHEWYNGGGYPAGDHDKLSLESMIICVADSYDAMTSDRPYRSKLSCGEAMKELHDKSGIQFSTKVVAAFERALIKSGELVK